MHANVEPINVHSLPQYSVVTFETASGGRMWAMRESADPAAPWMVTLGCYRLPGWLEHQRGLRVESRPV